MWWLMGMRPVVRRPTPPSARAKKYSRILSFGRPVSSAIWQLPIGAITRRFLIVRRLTWMGENIVSYGQSSLV